MLQSQISKDMAKTSLTVKTSLSQLYQTKSRGEKTKLRHKQTFLFGLWRMSCTYNGRALPRQIKQTWHCPSQEHLGRPRDRIKGSRRPWTLSVPNMHSSEPENSDPAHFNHHHVRWLCLLVIGSRRLICSSRIPQRFRHAVCRARAVERRPDHAVN